MMERLPNDLWIKIFLRLPVKTILQCLSVCKSWQLFIQHPSFVNAHLQHQRRDLMFIRYTPEDNNKKNEETTLAKKEITHYYSLHCDDENFNVYATYEFPISDYLPNYRVVESCNGVICVTNDLGHIGHETYLWNPTIQKCIELPPPVFTFKEIGPFEQELGFGFDKKNNDYKVVRIVTPDYLDVKVEIYTMSSGVWREASHLVSDLSVRFIEKMSTAKDCQPYLNGFVHWIGMDLKKSCSIVIAFNLTDEVFHCFELPINIYDHWNCRKSRLVVFQESLSFIHYEGQKCSIWTKKNYGDSTSWAKHVDVNLSNDVSRVIGLRRKGQLLLEIRGGLYSYDYEGAKEKELISLDEHDLQTWKLLQNGEILIEWEGNLYPYFVSQRIRNYDPESAPKELGIRSNTKGGLSFSFHSTSYTESLVLVGQKNCCQVESKTEECARIHEDDSKHVVDIVAELQNQGVEGMHIERS